VKDVSFYMFFQTLGDLELGHQITSLALAIDKTKTNTFNNSTS
jgi:hypothetical protein